jgi:release factor glutamine methyltransferase
MTLPPSPDSAQIPKSKPANPGRADPSEPQPAETKTAPSHSTEPQPPSSKAAPRPRSERNASEEKKDWTILELLRWTTDHFAARGIENPRLDAECLLAGALGVDRMRLYLDFDKPATAAERGVFRDLVKRRADQRVPVAQLTGRKEFWSLSLEVTEDVLVPRPDTETLVSAALGLLPANTGEKRVLDVGTGSGAVALAIASERVDAHVTATDVSAAALAVAARNAQALGLADRIRLIEGSLFEPVQGARFDLVVSNPPYLAESERSTLAPELAHEPDMALFAGPDGLAVLRALIAGLPEVLAPGGGFAVELAPAQAEPVAQWCRDVGLREIRVHRDLARRARVVSALDSLPPEETD